MGLDGGGLVRHIEEEFSIYLSNDELMEVYTVGNLYNLLLRRLKPTPDCLTSQAFYRIRKALTATLGLPCRSIRPATFLDDLFSEEHIRDQWGAVARESGLKLPSLRHTPMWKHWMKILSAALSFACIMTLARILSRFPFFTIDNYLVFFGFWALGFLLWGNLYTALLKATPFQRSVLPMLSAAELARVALSMNSAEFSQGAEATSELTDGQVWMRLVGVFCDQLALKPEEVLPSASIVVDLGES